MPTISSSTKTISSELSNRTAGTENHFKIKADTFTDKNIIKNIENHLPPTNVSMLNVPASTIKVSMMRMLNQVERNLLREEINREKELEFRQIIRYKDEEMKILRKTLLDEKNYEIYNLNEKIRKLQEEPKHSIVKDLKKDIEELKNSNEKCNELLKMYVVSVNKKDEIINKMKMDHEREINYILREARREQSKSTSELNQIKKTLNQSNGSNSATNRTSSEKSKVIEYSELTANELHLELQNVCPSTFTTEEKIKELTIRNIELNSLVQKLEEQIQQIKSTWNDSFKKIEFEKSQEESKLISNIKKTFGIQRAKDLADHARIVMLKDKEIKKYQSILEDSVKQQNKFIENEKALQFAEKERLRLERQLLKSSCTEIEPLQLEVDGLRQINILIAKELESLQKTLSSSKEEELIELTNMKELLKYEKEKNFELESNLLKMKNTKIVKEDKELQCNLLVSTESHIKITDINNGCHHIKQNESHFQNQLTSQGISICTQTECFLPHISAQNCSDYSCKQEFLDSPKIQPIFQNINKSSPKTNFDGSIQGVKDFNAFVSNYTYDPSVYSRNENFDLELPLCKGEKVYVYGDMDEDGFYLAELKSGERGLVPSNLIEKINDDVTSIPLNEKIDPVKDKLADNDPLSEEYLMKSFCISTVTDEIGTAEDTDEFQYSPPTKVHIERYLDNCMVVAWSPPLNITDMKIVKGYSIYVNGIFKQTVLGALRTKALVSNVDSKLCRVSVSTLMVGGMKSDPLLATVSVGNYQDIPREMSFIQTSLGESKNAFQEDCFRQCNETNYLVKNTESFIGVHNNILEEGQDTLSGDANGNSSDDEWQNIKVNASKVDDQIDGSASCIDLISDNKLTTHIIEYKERLVVSSNELSTIEEETESLFSSFRSTDSFSFDDKAMEINSVENRPEEPHLPYKGVLSKLMKSEFSLSHSTEPKDFLTKITSTELRNATFVDENHNKTFSFEVNSVSQDASFKNEKDLIDDYPELPFDDFDKLQNKTTSNKSAKNEQVSKNIFVGDTINEKKTFESSSQVSPIFLVEKNDALSLKYPSEKRPLSARRSLDFDDVDIIEHFSKGYKSGSIDKSKIEDKFNENPLSSIDKNKIEDKFNESPLSSIVESTIKPQSAIIYSFGIVDNSDSLTLPKVPISYQTNLFDQDEDTYPIDSLVDDKELVSQNLPATLEQANSKSIQANSKSIQKSFNNLEETLEKSNNHTDILKNYFTESAVKNLKTSPELEDCTLKEKDAVRVFIALYNYDPTTMSPNVDYASEELGFEEGDLIRIFGNMDEDGFYFGELNSVRGLVPSNMVKEVGSDNNSLLKNVRECNEESCAFKKDLKEKSLTSKSVTDLSQGYGINRLSASMPSLSRPESNLKTRKMMITLFPYDPNMSSPNVDSEVELAFQADEIAYIYGEMDEDGFYNGSINGRNGLIPSNFVREATDKDISNLATNSPKMKKKKSIFKKSKKIFSRLKGK